MVDWYDDTSASRVLPTTLREELLNRGFVVVPEVVPSLRLDALRRACDVAVSEADPGDLRVGSTSTRVRGLTGRCQELDELFINRIVLEACACIIQRPFKLSSLLARTVIPGSTAQDFHMDIQRDENGWPMAGFIVMVDDFRTGNGATRFVPASHVWQSDLGDSMKKPTGGHETQVLACGRAGSVIIYNSSIWHGHAANRSARPRRSIQGAYIRRDATAATNHAARLSPDALGRLGSLAAYLLAV